MKQECRLSSVWTTWAVVPTIAVALGVAKGWWVALFVTAVGVLAEFAYVRAFPYVSGLLGYGPVDDVKLRAGALGGQVPRVTLYTAMGCPFCPIVRQRLEQLQHDSHFQLEIDEHDVTFHPQLLKARGIRSVPAIEAGGRFLIGNATSEQLVTFLKGVARS